MKHLSGKILWIQDAVREGLIQLIQIPTLWNLSDIGTKALGIQRIRLLLHELNVAAGDGFAVVGEPEYQAQVERHGGGRQVSKLVKQIARVLVLMGLESATPRAMAMVTDSMVDDNFHGGVFQCSKEPNSVDQGGAFPSNTMFIFILMAVVCLCIFLFKTYRMARDAYSSYEHSYVQMSILDSAYNQVQNQYEALRREHHELQQVVANLRRTVHELESNQEMLSDGHDELHHGLVMLGGFTSHSTLTMDQRQHMYSVERANMLASRTMGAGRYMAKVFHQTRGLATGDDTDMGDTGAPASSHEGAESEAPTNDPYVALASPMSSLTQIHETLRNELNGCLAREAFSDAHEVQNCILLLLDSMNGAQPMEQGTRMLLLRRMGDKLEVLADRQRSRGEELIASRFQHYSDLLREIGSTT